MDSKMMNSQTFICNSTLKADIISSITWETSILNNGNKLNTTKAVCHVLDYIQGMVNLFCFPLHAAQNEEERPLLEASEVIVEHVPSFPGEKSWKTVVDGDKIDLGSVITDEEFNEFIKSMKPQKSQFHLLNLRLDCLNNTVVVPILNDSKWVKSIEIKNLGKIWESEQFRTYILCQGYQFLSKVKSFVYEIDSDISNLTLVLLREVIEICYNLSTLTLVPMKTSTSMDFHTCERYLQGLNGYSFEVFNLETLNIGSFQYPMGNYKMAILNLLKIFNFTKLRTLKITNVDIQLSQFDDILLICPGITDLKLYNINIKFTDLIDCLYNDYTITNRQLKVFDFQTTKDKGNFNNQLASENIEKDLNKVFSKLDSLHLSGNSNQLITDFLPYVNPKLNSLAFDYLISDNPEWVELLQNFKNLERLSIHMKFIKYMVKSPETLGIAIRSMQICDGLKELGLIGDFDHYRLSKTLVLISQAIELDQIKITNIPKKIMDALKENGAIGDYELLKYPQRNGGPPIGFEFWESSPRPNYLNK